MASRNLRHLVRWLIPVLAVVMASCAGAAPRLPRAGTTIRVVGPWTGVEQGRFEQVLQRFRVETGLQTVYTPAPDGVPLTLQRRRVAGLTEDVAFVPQPGLIREYADEGRLMPLDRATSEEVRSNYGAVWQQLGSVGGKLYAVWFKAADKSLIWYNVAALERVGAIPPGTLTGLIDLADRLRRAGIVPFALGAAGPDAWTLTDWFENVYLTTQGPARYELLAQHRIPWTDSSVLQTLRVLGRLLQPANLVGGTAGALHTTFVGSVAETFASPYRAAMIQEGDFVAGVISGSTRAQLGVDADVFRFPVETPASPWIIGGGDAAVLMSDSPAAIRLMHYLASPEAGAIWASLGGFVSPNLNVGLDRYPDGISRSVALDVVDAGDSFLFDMSDLQPPSFGSTQGQGLFASLQQFLAQGDPSVAAARLEAQASEAYAK